MISSLKNKLDVVVVERNHLKKKMDDYDVAAAVEAQTITKLSQKVFERNILKKKLDDFEVVVATDARTIAILRKTVTQQ